MKIAVCAPHEVDAIWHLVVEGISKAIVRSENMEDTAGDLWTLCRSGRGYLILVWDEAGIRMASVWQFEKRNGKSVFNCRIMYGTKMKEWVNQAREWITKLAKDNGAEYLVSAGRRGWLRYFNAATWGDEYALKVT